VTDSKLCFSVWWSPAWSLFNARILSSWVAQKLWEKCVPLLATSFWSQSHSPSLYCAIDWEEDVPMAQARQSLRKNGVGRGLMQLCSVVFCWGEP
jgi:hypothetical protein